MSPRAVHDHDTRNDNPLMREDSEDVLSERENENESESERFEQTQLAFNSSEVAINTFVRISLTKLQRSGPKSAALNPY